MSDDTKETTELDPKAHPIIAAVSSWDSKFGKFACWVWRFAILPIIGLCYWATTAYLNGHYVSQPRFDEAMATLSQDKQHYAAEQRTGLDTISTKLDALLLRDSANGQRFSDYDRRLDKIELKVDRLSERLYSPSPNAAH